MRISLLITPLCIALFLWSGIAHADRPAPLSAQTLKLPNGAASMKGLGESFSADVATGSGSYSVPIEVPPATLPPSLALSYAAGRGKTALGLSWDLPLVNVYRTTDKGSPSFAETDRFAVSGPGLNDELVRVDAATGTYRLKNEGAFALFVRNAGSDSWTVRLPNGHTLYLGESAQAREGTSRGTYRWYIERHADKFEHEIRYVYTRNQSRLYPSEVRYQLQAHSANGSLVAIDTAYQNRVSFGYESRPDVFADYSYGERVTTAQRLRTITVSQGPRVLRTYTLSYRNSLLFSLLTSVRMTGEGGLSLPVLSFDYLEPTLMSGRYVEMVSRPPLEGLLNGSAQFEDMNADSLPDLLVGTAGNYRYYENIDGVSWSSTATAISGSPDRNLYDSDVILADFDGDGDRDVGHSQGSAFRYFPAGATWRGVFQGFGTPITLNTSDTGFSLTSREVKLSDLNSDGRTDLIWQKPGQDAQLLNASDRLQSSYITELPVDVDFQDSRVQLLDFNGDGVLDFVRQEIGWNPSRVRVWYGLGNGAYAAEQQMLNVPTGDATEFSLQDVNRDGQTDLVRVSGSHATYFLNDGNQRFTGARGDFYGLPSVSSTRRLMYADMNGNGTTDVVWLTLDGKLTYLDLVGEPFFGLLSRIDNGMGAVTDIAYRSSTAYAVDAKRAGQSWRTTLPMSVPVIAEVVTSDSLEVLGLPWESRTSYEYRDGYYDGPEREFRGFGTAILTEWGDDATATPGSHETLITETRMHVGRNLSSGADEEVLKGKTYVQLKKTRSGGIDQIYLSEETTWEQKWLCQEALAGVSQVVLPRCNNFANRTAAKDSLVTVAVSTASLTGSWEKTTSPRYSATATEYDNTPAGWMLSWGQRTREVNYGEVTFAASRVPGSGFDLATANTSVGDDEVVTETLRAVSIGSWIVNIPYQTRALGPGDRVVAQTRTFFDGEPYQGLALGQLTKGLPSRVEAWNDRQSPWVPTERTAYNADGLASSTLDANANLIEFEYDARARNLVTVERTHVESGPLEFRAVHDLGYGTITEATDMNGQVMRFGYDGLGRVTSIVDPLSTVALPTVTYTYEDPRPDRPLAKVTTNTLVDRAAQRYRRSVQYSDGLARSRLTKVQAEAAHGFVASGFTVFTPRGEANRGYDSFPSANDGFEIVPPGTPNAVRSLDALGRTTETYLPATRDVAVGIQRTRYLPFETRAYDERDVAERTEAYATITRFDGRGRARETVKVNDQQGTTKTLTWKAEYDALDRVVAYMDPAWTENATAPNRDARSKRVYEYDALGRLVALTDPNLGHITYEHDDLGNLVKRVDPLGQEERREYGLANRLLSRRFSHDASGKPDYRYDLHYDEAAAGGPLAGATGLIGKLAWVEFPTGREHYGYDTAGRQTKTVAELWNPATSSFSQQGRDAFVRSQVLNAEGKPTSVSLPGGFTFSPTYNERGLLAGMTARAGTDERTVLRDVSYDARGLVTFSGHGNGTGTCSAYDERGRVVGVLSARLSRSDCGRLGTAGYGFQHLRLVRTFNGNIASVQDLSVELKDAEGKLTVPRLSATYTYDHLNQLVSASDARGASTFGYDSTQNIVSRTFVGNAANPTTTLPTGPFTYGERGAGPNMITGAGSHTLDYDAAGRLDRYNGYELDYDVEGRLVSATKGSTSITYHYDAWGERRLMQVKRGSAAAEVSRFVFGEYEQRSGDDTWIVSGGSTQVEATRSKGVVIDDQLFLLEQIQRYVRGRARDPKPLPAEYMDFDGDGDLDEADLAIANAAYGSTDVRERLGGERLIWRYYHHDQIASVTHATDSVGDLVNHQLHDVYGKNVQRLGMGLAHGFAGAELGADSDLGLVRFGTRYYAPDLGRWITGDRFIAESPTKSLAKLLESNAYGYALNNPLTVVDPTGRSGKQVKIAFYTIGDDEKTQVVAGKTDKEGKPLMQSKSETFRQIATSLVGRRNVIGVHNVNEAMAELKRRGIRDGSVAELYFVGHGVRGAFLLNGVQEGDSFRFEEDEGLYAPSYTDQHMGSTELWDKLAAKLKKGARVGVIACRVGQGYMTEVASRIHDRGVANVDVGGYYSDVESGPGEEGLKGGRPKARISVNSLDNMLNLGDKTWHTAPKLPAFEAHANSSEL